VPEGVTVIGPQAGPRFSPWHHSLPRAEELKELQRGHPAHPDEGCAELGPPGRLHDAPARGRPSMREEASRELLIYFTSRVQPDCRE